MNGTEKQIAWAENILEPVRELIEQFPEDIKDKHLRSMSQIESAKTVIDCRGAIAGWCERAQEWLNVNVLRIVSEDVAMRSGTPAAFTAPARIRSVVF